jgi:hypothetical protein
MKRLVMMVTLCMVLMGVLTPSLASRASAMAPAAPVASVAHTHAALFDKTRFLLHMGLAYYAFHHWVWTPYKAGQLGMSHKGNTVKAGIALLFTVHECKVAYGIAKGSNSATLHAIIAPLNALMSAATSAGDKLKAGDYNAADISHLGSLTSSIGTTASKGGYAIKDIKTAIPGL